MKWLSFFLVPVLLSFTVKAQTSYTFGYNIYNGLPSNNIYGVLTDHLGYLWIATEKGVVRYNGFEFKVFNQVDGISNEDIWELNEDKKGRIWLSNISDELGYIYNNKYHKAFIEGKYYTIYPKDLHQLNNGIVFYSRNIGGDGKLYVCFEKNDTIHKYNIEKLFNSKYKDRYLSTILFAKSDEPLILDNSYNIYKAGIDGVTPKIQLLIKLENKSLRHDISYLFQGVIGNYLIYYSVAKKPNKFYAVSLKDGMTQEISIKNVIKSKYINYIFFDVHGGNHLYVMTDNRILNYACEPDSLKYVESYNVADEIEDTAISAGKIGTFHKDKFWGSCIGTPTNGLWLNYRRNNYFNKEKKINLEDYNYVGGANDSISFWWSDVKNTLAKIEKNGDARYYKYLELKKVFSVIPYNNDTFLVNGVYSYLFTTKTGTLTTEEYYASNIHSIIKSSTGVEYAIAITGFAEINRNNNDHIVKGHYIDRDRYRGLIYDSFHKNYWAYNFDRVYIHGRNKDTLIGKENLSDLGVQKIEKIAVDNQYGNFFIEGNNNFVIYDYDKNTYVELFKNFNLKESSFLIYRNVVIITGRFGVLYCKILGKGNISPPMFYPNLKNKNYNFVYNSAVLNGKLLFNTDKGTYSVKIPEDSEILNGRMDSQLFSYRFILSYLDSPRNVISGDTLTIYHKDHRLQFDVINPFGNGHARYIYKLTDDSAWHELNANELTLPVSLVPDNYYDLAIKTYDNVWKSDPITIHLYIRPYWYQTYTGKRLVWAGISLLFLVFLALSVLLTRYMVMRANKKRNMRMELELKSIYAQINPHFIFNTLNSALLLVSKNRMDEAYTHISKFSRLLRAYIKSSRNKLITIEEEIKNLRDYIELQQTRFKDKFGYVIEVSPLIQPGRIKIPSLLLQPFVENAINHGILLKKERGHIKIAFGLAKEKNEIMCTIEDNGVGRKYSKAINELDKKKEGSYGDLLIRDLVSIFNKFEQMNIHISFTDKEGPDTGTIVTILIKNPHYDQ